jgi:anti-sigma B factor antagonist
MAREFEIDAYRKDRELLIVLRGRLVLPQCQDAKTRLQNLFTPQVEQIYMHLPGLSFLDSAGLGVLVGLKMLANKNRTRLTFLAPPPRIEDIFRVSKLDTIFEIRGGVEADVICAALQKEDYVVWRDSKDTRQAMFNTDISDTPNSRGGAISNLTTGDSTTGEAGQRVRQLLMDAVEYMRQGDLGKAVDAYQRALRLEPDNLSALNNLGIVYEKNPAWYPQALEIWKKVLELSSAHGDEKHAERARKHLDTLAKLIS